VLISTDAEDVKKLVADAEMLRAAAAGSYAAATRAPLTEGRDNGLAPAAERVAGRDENCEEEMDTVDCPSCGSTMLPTDAACAVCGCARPTVSLPAKAQEKVDTAVPITTAPLAPLILQTTAGGSSATPAEEVWRRPLGVIGRWKAALARKVQRTRA
jgi:hypothetical protein